MASSDVNRDNDAGVLTFNTRKQLHRIHGDVPSIATFLVLCAYLYVLVQWDIGIHPQDYDTFIVGHTTYLEHPSNLTFPYHVWLADNADSFDLKSNIVTQELLRRLKGENPYTFTLVESCMALAVKTASALET